jgi:hypothetical protein
MRDDPRKNLKWLEQELRSSETVDPYMDETAELLAMADLVLEEDPEPPVFVQQTKKQTKGQQAEEAHIVKQFDESAAVLTKTKKQLRREAKLQKKANVNRNIKGLVFLAILEILGILAILGWWLQ